MDTEQAIASGRQFGQRVIGQRADHTGAQVRDRAHVKHYAARGQFPQQARVFGSPDAVPDPVGAEAVERTADRRRAGRLAGVRHRREPALAGDPERPRERFGRVLSLRAAQADAHYSAVTVGHRMPGGQLCRLQRVTARDVGSQPDLDAVLLGRLLSAVAVTGEHLIPVAAAPGRLAGVKIPSM